MSIVRRKAKILKSKKLTSQQSENIRKAYIKMVEKRAEKDKHRFTLNMGHNEAYFNAFRRYVLSEVNETTAAVTVARRDTSALAQKYRMVARSRSDG